MPNCSTFSDYATRLREFIRPLESGVRNPKCGIELEPPHLGECEFNLLALELFALQFAVNEPYRRFCLARGATPETITDWAGIPAIPTSAFKELELTCLPPEERTTVFHSSGTGAQRPSRHFHNAESLAIYEASLLRWFGAHMQEHRPSESAELGGERSPSPRPSLPGEGASSSAHDMFKSRFRIVSLTPSPDESPHSSLVHMFETVCREFGSADSVFLGHVASDGTWALDVDVAIAALGRSCRPEEVDGVVTRTPSRIGGCDLPVVLLGTAFLFVRLLDFLVENNLRFKLRPGSRVLETGGYKGRSRELPRAELHALVTERLGVPPAHVICEYGMSELSSQAYDRMVGKTANPQPCFRFPPWARAQIISPETGREVGEGETGLIRVFDLANVYSAMAIQTEDLGVRRGDGFELLGRAEAAEPRGCSLMTD